MQSTGGEGGIRTPETFKGFTRFPGVRLKPLGHLSVKKSALYTNFFRLSPLMNKFISPQLWQILYVLKKLIKTKSSRIYNSIGFNPNLTKLWKHRKCKFCKLDYNSLITTLKNWEKLRNFQVFLFYAMYKLVSLLNYRAY